MPWEKAQFFDNNGKPVAGGCLFTYISGTNTPLATYTDFTGSFLNSNPVILDSAGRADIWLLAQAYSFRLKTFGGTACASGTQLWTEDGINPSANSILAFNNVWTGLNVFNAAVTFNSTATFTTGLTASGPVNMNAGGAMNGTFTGGPIFSGTPNFSGGMQATTGLFTDQITSTVVTGTPPLVIASTTNVPNLNASSINGCTFPVPCALGSTTPAAVTGTTVVANTSLQVGAGTPQVGTQGTDTNLLTAGAFTGATNTAVCKDANGGATTVGCTPVKLVQFVKKTSSTCTTTASSYNTCTDVLTWPVSFGDTAYSVTCQGVNPNINEGGESESFSINSYNASTVTVATQTQAARTAHAIELHCIGVHN